MFHEDHLFWGYFSWCSRPSWKKNSTLAKYLIITQKSKKCVWGGGGRKQKYSIANSCVRSTDISRKNWKNQILDIEFSSRIKKYRFPSLFERSSILMNLRLTNTQNHPPLEIVFFPLVYTDFTHLTVSKLLTVRISRSKIRNGCLCFDQTKLWESSYYDQHFSIFNLISYITTNNKKI